MHQKPPRDQWLGSNFLQLQANCLLPNLWRNSLTLNKVNHTLAFLALKIKPIHLFLKRFNLWHKGCCSHTKHWLIEDTNMKALIAATTILCSSAAMAQDCNMNIKGHMTLNHSNLTLKLDDNRSLLLDGHSARLNGNAMNLDADQLYLLNSYHQKVETLAPKVANLALDAVSLANEGINRAFNELLGEDNDLVADLSAEIENLRGKLTTEFYAQDGSIRFDSARFEDGEFLGEDFEKEFEQRIESLVQRSMGSLMIALGKEMLFSGGDMKAFEARMESFGAQLEADMEAKADDIEAKAEVLCVDLRALDRLENEINDEIPALANLDMIKVSASSQSM